MQATEVAATPVAAPQATPSDCSAVNSYDWDVTTAYAVCMAESRGNTNATSPVNWDGSIDRGLMQVNSVHADMVGGDLTSLYQPAVNLRVAYSLYSKHHDFTPWSTYNNGAYRKYL